MTTQNRRIIAVIPAAGVGSRMQADCPKQYLKPRGSSKTVLELTVAALAQVREIDDIAVAVSPGDTVAQTLDLPARVMKTGGESRALTVLNTLEALAPEVNDHDLVLIHDAARPFVQACDVKSLIENTLQVLENGTAAGAVLAMPVSDTVKRCSSTGILTEDIDREGLVRIATPQCFEFGVLLQALKANVEVTDESSAVRAAGLNVLAVECSPRNIKLTRPSDMLSAFGRDGDSMKLKIGLGYDSHRLEEGRDFILGGVKIEHSKGLAGHSDADCLLHAVTDAVLGAAGCGNIGMLFPDNDPAFKNADSRVLLRRAYEVVKARGWRVVNVDAVVVAQKPKLNPHVAAMQTNIAADLEIAPEDVSVKPKTNEKLGFEGREEGVSTQAVVMLQSTIQ